ncbi:hypothetical protein [Escherichia coli]|uniref:hypothetical protein n=1 Tax=Escherichia coli TaxID=562 RepID=UPI001FCAE327|nr:hypothetical protein [Escherichia coli]
MMFSSVVHIFRDTGRCSVNDRKITADGKEGPGDRSGEAYPCIPASPAKMEARHSPHTTRRPHN